MMKKTLFLSLLCVLLLAFSGGVLADAAVYDWEVSENCSYDAYVSTVDGGVNLRVEPNTESSILCTIPDFVCLHISMESSNGWGYTDYNGNYGYLHGDFVRVMTNAEYYEWQNKNATPAPTVTAMPDPSTFSNLALTTIDRVKIRQSGSMNGRELTLDIVIPQPTEVDTLSK